MKNKENIDGTLRGRPCFFAFPDDEEPKIFWIVPISSKFEKYEKIAKKATQKYGECKTIRFGNVLSRKSVFLIQNMCPATENYLTAYIDKNNVPVRTDDRIAGDVIRNAKSVLGMYKHGANVIFPNVQYIYAQLRSNIEKENTLAAEVVRGSKRKKSRDRDER